MPLKTQYQVPQFIEVEDKVVGPLTLRQFFILAAGLGIGALLFMILRLAFAVVLAVPVVTLAFALAFVKVSGLPFWRYVLSALSFTVRDQEYFWKK